MVAVGTLYLELCNPSITVSTRFRCFSTNYEYTVDKNSVKDRSARLLLNDPWDDPLTSYISDRRHPPRKEEVSQ